MKIQALLLVLTGTATLPAVANEYEPYISFDKGLDAAWVSSLQGRGDRRVYKGDELRLISMPCGGIGAGQVEVTGDGQLGSWWIFNVSPEPNLGRGFTSGAGYMDPLPIEKRVESGFAVRIKTKRDEAKVLKLDGRDFDDIYFIGEYPMAQLSYQSSELDLPVKISSKVYSPFVPLSVRDSANPVTVLRYTVTNTSGQPVEIDLGGWLENPCVSKAKAERLNKSFSGKTITGVQMGLKTAWMAKPEKKEEAVLYEDFEGDSFGDRWTIEGWGFTDKPLRVYEAPFTTPMTGYGGVGVASSRNMKWDSQPAVGKLTSKPFEITHDQIRFKVAGGAYENETCVHLIIEGEVVRTATGKNSYHFEEVTWDVSDLKGKMAHFVLLDDRPGGSKDPHAQIMVDDIYFVNPGHRMPFYPVGNKEPEYGDMAISVLDENAVSSAHWNDANEFLSAFEKGNISGDAERIFAKDQSGVGSVVSSFKLAPEESRTVTFLVSWYFPNLFNYGAGGCVGHIYNNWYNSSVEAAQWIADNDQRLLEQTELFRSTYHDTTLPYWLANRISMPVSTLACDNVKIHADGRMYCFEGVNFCAGTCGHVYNFVTAIAILFPELERSVRLMQDFNDQYGFDPKTGRINFRGEHGADPAAYCNYASDAQSGYVLKAYREHLHTTDLEFLKTIWPKVKLAMNYQVFRDGAERSLEPNGVLESKQTFWDPMGWGPNPYNNTLYLAALRAAEEMARLMGEERLATRYHGLVESGSKWMQDNMWNGEHYIMLYPEGKWSTSWNGVVNMDEEQNNAASYVRAFSNWDEHYYPSTACDAQQLFGQNWARQLGLGYILPQEHCHSAAAHIYKYNFATDIADVYDIYPPHNRTLAASGEAALVNGAWPKVERQSFENTHDKDDIWSGLEYEAACNMINEGLLDEALVVIRAIHDRYEPIKRNPWNEIEGADHYSRAMQSWNVLLSLSGFTCDGPAGQIGFAPKMSPENFKSFFSAAEGWGTFMQARTQKTQSNVIKLVYGKLTLNSIVLDVAEGAAADQVELKLSGRMIPAELEQTGQRVLIKLDQQLILNAEDRLEIRMK